VGGGSGITPLQSICNHLLTERIYARHRKTTIKRVSGEANDEFIQN
jgi:ferredoxin-NADP reductase